MKPQSTFLCQTLCDGCNIDAVVFGCQIRTNKQENKCPCKACLLKVMCTRQCKERMMLRTGFKLTNHSD